MRKATAISQKSTNTARLIAIGTLAVAVILALVSQSSHAQTPPQSPPPQGQSQGAPNGAGANFAEHQQKELAHIGQRIQILQTLQSCVQSATNHAAVKACHETAKQSEQALHHP